jgi:membrane protein YdbS with pleckstrin-like domain
MTYLSSDGLDEITFRPFLMWYLLAYALLFGFGAACLWFAITSAGAWLTGVLLAVSLALLLVARYNAQAVIIRGNDLVLRTGTIKARERIFPIWAVDLEVDQGLLARLLDYATIQQRTDREVIVVHTIASIRALRFLIAQRRLFVFRMLAEQHFVTVEPPLERHVGSTMPLPAAYSQPWRVSR